MAEMKKRYAVVTGANKGIGFAICKQLASNGIVVVVTARDEKRGVEAVDKLRECGLSDDQVCFHQLDVADTASIASLAHFIRTQYGKLDILVNNAGVLGVISDADGFSGLMATLRDGDKNEWKDTMTQTYELAEECLKINYYGTKRMVEAFIPLLQLSDSPRIVNVSSGAGALKYVPNEWAKGILSDVENLTEERVEEVLNEYLKDFKEGSIKTKDWPTTLSAYKMSKAAMNAYTRILAKKYPNFLINCVCPGFVKTDINYNTGNLSAEEGAESVARLALLPNNGPTGCYFIQKENTPF